MELARFILLLLPIIGGNAEKLILSVSNQDTSGIRQCQEPDIVSCKKVTINPLAKGASTIIFPDNKSIDISPKASKGSAYVYDHQDGSEAVLVYGTNDRLKAVINMYNPNKLYFVHNCGGDCYVLVEESDVKNQPKVESRSGDMSERRSPLPSRELERLNRLHMDRTGMTTVTVFFYYTTDFALAESGDPNAYISMLVALANTGYSNSNLQIQLEAFCSEELPFTESNVPGTNLDMFETAKGTIADLTRSADIALLLLSEPKSNVCGQAYLRVFNSGLRIGWIGRGCQPIVTGHEVGHMFGALHNREQHEGGLEGFSYEYGYLMRTPESPPQPSGFCTIMAYPELEYGSQLNVFSSPNLFHTNNGMSIPTGTANDDTARLHDLNKGLMAGLGDESTACPNGPSPPTTTTTTTNAPPPCIDTLPEFICYFKKLFGLCQFADCQAICAKTCGVCTA